MSADSGAKAQAGRTIASFDERCDGVATAVVDVDLPAAHLVDWCWLLRRRYRKA